MSREAAGPVRSPLVPLALFLVALAVHGGVWLQYGDDPFATLYIADAESYHLWAERLVVSGLDEEPVFHQAPLFPLLLAAAYRVLPEAARAGGVALLQILLSSLAVTLLLPIGRLFFRSTAVGLAAAAVALLHAPVAFYALKLLPTSLALFTQAAGLAVLGLALRSGRASLVVAAGAVWGIGCLARPEMLLFLPLAGLALWQRSGRRVGPPLLFLAAAALLVSPATLHNLRRGDLVPVASSGGENLFIGNQRGAQGGYKALDPRAGDLFAQRVAARDLAERATGRQLRPSEISSYWRGRALAEMRADVPAWLRLELRKLGRVLHPGDPTDLYSLALERSLYLTRLHGSFVGPLTLLLLAIGGGLLLRRPGLPTPWPLVALLAVHLLVLLLFFVDSRLRLPFYFFLTPFAGRALVAGARRWRDRRGRPLLVGLGVLLVASVIVGTLWSRPREREVLRASAVLSRQGRLDEALAVLEPQLSGSHPSAIALDQAGWVLQKTGDDMAARQRYLEALRGDLPPARARQTRTRLGQVLERLGEHGPAAEQHDLAARSPYANAGTFYERGMFRLRRGDRAGAIADLRRSIELDPGYPAPRQALRALPEAAR